MVSHPLNFKAVTETTNKSHTHLKATRQAQCWRDENSSFRFFICCIHSLPARAFLNVVMLVAVVKNHVEKSFLQPFLSFFLLQLLNIIPKKKIRRALLHFINWALAIFYITIFRLQVATIIQRWLWGCRITSFTINFLVYQFTLLTILAAFGETLYWLVIAI